MRGSINLPSSAPSGGPSCEGASFFWAAPFPPLYLPSFPFEAISPRLSCHHKSCPLLSTAENGGAEVRKRPGEWREEASTSFHLLPLCVSGEGASAKYCRDT